MVSQIGRDDFSGDAGAVSIAFDQSFRTFCLSDSALGLIRAGILWEFGNSNFELRRNIDQRLTHIVADQRFLTVSRTGFVALGHIDDLFDARQIGGKRFVTLLLLLRRSSRT